VFNSKKDGLTKLIVGGLHGREGKITEPILKKLIMGGKANQWKPHSYSGSM
jgi:hypothetical protein